MSDPSNNIMPIGTMLREGKLRVVRHLGSGGFGNTYLAEDTTSGTRYAMKEFYMKGINERDDTMTVSVSNPANEDTFRTQQQKFIKEAIRMSNLHSQNIARVYDQFDENGTSYYLMEFIDGVSLTEHLKRNQRPLGESEAMGIYSQLLNALEAMHAIRLWHLDIKPSNIMMEHTGRAVLIDFGASKQTSPNSENTIYTSTTNSLSFTPPYAPIEQVMQSLTSVGPWSDIYALGATLYYMLTRHQAPKPDELNRANSFRYPDSVSEQVRQLVKWSMQYERGNRPQSVEQIRQFLKTGVKPLAETELETEKVIDDEIDDIEPTDDTANEDSRQFDENSQQFNESHPLQTSSGQGLQFNKGQMDFQATNDNLAFSKNINNTFNEVSSNNTIEKSFQTKHLVAIIAILLIAIAIIAFVI